ncbi:conserved protein, unknown function [Plasmodium ovale]|uniref:Cilia- and flagella-associated protein 298 n=1 Tax=Plasmodium ovale TaxID=36330 RepID=A0A1C3KQQ5_PLAOA|nr:conserved protein, unknown function [Plasmodium ovale]
MVLIHIKTSEDGQQFLYETSVNVLLKSLKDELVCVYNLRSKILKLLDASSELAKHGPLRPEHLRGLSDEELQMSKMDMYDAKDVTAPDENNFRTGIPPPLETATKLKEVVTKVKSELSLEGGGMSMVTTLDKLNEYLSSIVLNLNACYPSLEGLPPYDPVRLILEQENCFNDEFVSTETSMWWAGKELPDGSHLRNIIGKNEKTKIVVRLQPTKMGPPEREARIDSETYKAMLAYYHKKQKEEKEFEEDDDDSYLNSEWANPLSLQKQLHGNLGNIRWKP